MASLLRRLAVVLAVTLGTGALAQPDPRAAAALRRIEPWLSSVVMIRITCPGGRIFAGSGVVVSDHGHVLTAAHVGSACPEVTAARMGAVRSPYAAPGGELAAILIARRADGVDSPDKSLLNRLIFEDLALWRITDFAGSGLTPARLSSRFQGPGEEVTVVGFASLPFSYVRNPHGHQAGLTVHRVSLLSVAATANEVPYRLHYRGGLLPGTSGGPVFDAAGDLVGVHSTLVTGDLTDLVSTGCVVPVPPDPDDGNCRAILSPDGSTVLGTVGVNYLRVKAVLDNYSFATSIHAVPSIWLARP